MTKNSKIGLPEKPSALIRLALRDLAKAEKTKGMRVDMGQWMWRQKKTCTVCLAGAVLAQHFELNDGETVWPTSLSDRGMISESDRDKLRALDDFRLGLVQRGLNEMKIKNNPIGNFVGVDSYSISPTQFKTDLRALAKMLKENGL